jgi:hypothetical protein
MGSANARSTLLPTIAGVDCLQFNTNVYKPARQRPKHPALAIEQYA